jgi:precorrin-2 methylase
MNFKVSGVLGSPSVWSTRASLKPRVKGEGLSAGSVYVNELVPGVNDVTLLPATETEHGKNFTFH